MSYLDHYHDILEDLYEKEQIDYWKYKRLKTKLIECEQHWEDNM